MNTTVISQTQGSIPAANSGACNLAATGLAFFKYLRSIATEILRLGVIIPCIGIYAALASQLLVFIGAETPWWIQCSPALCVVATILWTKVCWTRVVVDFPAAQSVLQLINDAVVAPRLRLAGAAGCICVSIPSYAGLLMLLSLVGLVVTLNRHPGGVDPVPILRRRLRVWLVGPLLISGGVLLALSWIGIASTTAIKLVQCLPLAAVTCAFFLHLPSRTASKQFPTIPSPVPLVNGHWLPSFLGLILFVLGIWFARNPLAWFLIVGLIIGLIPIALYYLIDSDMREAIGGIRNLPSEPDAFANELDDSSARISTGFGAIHRPSYLRPDGTSADQGMFGLVQPGDGSNDTEWVLWRFIDPRKSAGGSGGLSLIRSMACRLLKPAGLDLTTNGAMYEAFRELESPPILRRLQDAAPVPTFKFPWEQPELLVVPTRSTISLTIPPGFGLYAMDGVPLYVKSATVQIKINPELIDLSSDAETPDPRLERVLLQHGRIVSAVFCSLLFAATVELKNYSMVVLHNPAEVGAGLYDLNSLRQAINATLRAEFKRLCPQDVEVLLISMDLDTSSVDQQRQENINVIRNLKVTDRAFRIKVTDTLLQRIRNDCINGETALLNRTRWSAIVEALERATTNALKQIDDSLENIPKSAFGVAAKARDALTGEFGRMLDEVHLGVAQMELDADALQRSIEADELNQKWNNQQKS